jgi:hypothetical protein
MDSLIMSTITRKNVVWAFFFVSQVFVILSMPMGILFIQRKGSQYSYARSTSSFPCFVGVVSVSAHCLPIVAHSHNLLTLA